MRMIQRKLAQINNNVLDYSWQCNHYKFCFNYKIIVNLTPSSLVSPHLCSGHDKHIRMVPPGRFLVYAFRNSRSDSATSCQEKPCSHFSPRKQRNCRGDCPVLSLLIALRRFLASIYVCIRGGLSQHSPSRNTIARRHNTNNA